MDKNNKSAGDNDSSLENKLRIVSADDSGVDLPNLKMAGMMGVGTTWSSDEVGLLDVDSTIASPESEEVIDIVKSDLEHSSEYEAFSQSQQDEDRENTAISRDGASLVSSTEIAGSNLSGFSSSPAFSDEKEESELQQPYEGSLITRGSIEQVDINSDKVDVLGRRDIDEEEEEEDEVHSGGGSGKAAMLTTSAMPAGPAALSKGDVDLLRQLGYSHSDINSFTPELFVDLRASVVECLRGLKYTTDEINAFKPAVVAVIFKNRVERPSEQLPTAWFKASSRCAAGAIPKVSEDSRSVGFAAPGPSSSTQLTATANQPVSTAAADARRGETKQSRPQQQARETQQGSVVMQGEQDRRTKVDRRDLRDQGGIRDQGSIRGSAYGRDRRGRRDRINDYEENSHDDLHDEANASMGRAFRWHSAPSPRPPSLDDIRSKELSPVRSSSDTTMSRAGRLQDRERVRESGGERGRDGDGTIGKMILYGKEADDDDDDEEDNDAFWPSVEDFKDMLLDESRMRMEVAGGSWISPLLREENKWRFRLYEGWKNFLTEGFGDAFDVLDTDDFEPTPLAPRDQKRGSRSSSASLRGRQGGGQSRPQQRRRFSDDDSDDGLGAYYSNADVRGNPKRNRDSREEDNRQGDAPQQIRGEGDYGVPSRGTIGNIGGGFRQRAGWKGTEELLPPQRADRDGTTQPPPLARGYTQGPQRSQGSQGSQRSRRSRREEEEEEDQEQQRKALDYDRYIRELRRSNRALFSKEERAQAQLLRREREQRRLEERRFGVGLDSDAPYPAEDWRQNGRELGRISPPIDKESWFSEDSSFDFDVDDKSPDYYAGSSSGRGRGDSDYEGEQYVVMDSRRGGSDRGGRPAGQLRRNGAPKFTEGQQGSRAMRRGPTRYPTRGHGSNSGIHEERQPWDERADEYGVQVEEGDAGISFNGQADEEEEAVYDAADYDDGLYAKQDGAEDGSDEEGQEVGRRQRDRGRELQQGGRRSRKPNLEETEAWRMSQQRVMVDTYPPSTPEQFSRPDPPFPAEL